MSENTNSIPNGIDDKLFSVKYKPDVKPHLVPNQENCKKCTDKPCRYFCPANVYDWDDQQEKLLVGYENCLECGACRIGCVYKSIDWTYPKSGCGVTFKQG